MIKNIYQKIINFLNVKSGGLVPWAHRASTGFTLIETLVAISIFAISVTVLVVVSGGGLADLSVAKNRLVANYLAQEGIELVRYQRDQDLATSVGWPVFVYRMTQSCTANQPCNLDPISSTLQGVGQCATCDTMKVVPSTGYYTFEQGMASATAENTIFKRSIVVNPIMHSNNPDIDEVEVISTVTWQQGINNFNVSLKTSLFNW